MKLIKRTLILCLCLSLVLSSFVTADIYADKIVETADESYEEAVEILNGLGLITKTYQPNSTITRAEFADMMVRILGLDFYEENSNSPKVQSGRKYLGYTNDPDFDENGDWVYDADAFVTEEDADSYENATPFKDVLTTHQYWNSIKTIASQGLMIGDENRYFYPNKAITFIEVQKILVYACGFAAKVIDNYPSSILAEASGLKLLKNVNQKAYDDVITYRDIAIMLKNVLEANIYEAVSYKSDSVELKLTKDETFLSYYHGIFVKDGILDTNKVTSLKNHEGTGADIICINGEKFNTMGANYDNLLGYDVDVYYVTTQRSNMPEIVYIRANETNEEIIVKAGEIIDYKNNKLEYQKDDEKLKSQYIGANTNIIYNGKALTDYTKYSDSVLIPKNGDIRFVNADADGKYETVFINNIQTVIVSGIDYTERIIYNKLESPKSIQLNEENTYIKDADGIEYALTDLTINSILNVKQTLPTQGDALVDIVRSFDVITGILTEHNEAEKEVTIDSQVYSYAADFDTKNIKLGVMMTFYLNSNDEIFYAEHGSQLTYGYFAGTAPGKRSDVGNIILYDLCNDKVKVYELAEKVIVNKSSVKPADLYSVSALYDSRNSDWKAQLIKYRLDEQGLVKEILTAGIDENEFVEIELGGYKGKSLKYRKATNVLVDKTPVLYLNADTVYSRVPVENYDNNDLYDKEILEDNETYKVDRAYKDNNRTMIASVVLLESENLLTLDEKLSISSEYTELSVVKDIREVRTENDETGLKITGATGKTNIFTANIIDDELINYLKGKIDTGDLIRFNVDNNGNIIRLQKVFDAKEALFTKAANPYASNSASYNTTFHCVHGRVVKKHDDGRFITVAPFIYSTSNGEIILGDINTDETTWYTYPSTMFKAYLYNSKLEEVTDADALTDLISDEDAGIGSEVVVYTSNSNPVCIYIFK